MAVRIGVTRIEHLTQLTVNSFNPFFRCFAAISDYCHQVAIERN